ncbi:hypothetical protein ACF1GT_25705 [Streptomyces sp. NPDC014636]|uniref:hypothetical protein n=1 Tax=Streptomyces sp. NPDC014636 TaxID=3364876 RepID=UPI0036FE0A81
MNWKNRTFATTALGTAIVLGGATAAYAAGPHYPTSHGLNGGGSHNECAYNWTQSDTQGFPGHHGEHVFTSGIAYYSAALSDPRCHAHVEMTYKNNVGEATHIWGKKVQNNGSFDAMVPTKSYKLVYQTEIWVTDGSGKTIKGTYLMVDPKGKILAKA